MKKEKFALVKPLLGTFFSSFLTTRQPGFMSTYQKGERSASLAPVLTPKFDLLPRLIIVLLSPFSSTPFRNAIIARLLQSRPLFILRQCLGRYKRLFIDLLISSWAMGFKLKNVLLNLCQLSHPFALQTAVSSSPIVK
jgi:hypothetical protein